MTTEQSITQESLAALHRHHPHRIRVDQLDDEERKIYDALKGGGEAQPGIHKVSLHKSTSQQRIYWRHEVEKLAEKLKMPTYIADLEEEARKTKKEVEYLVFE